MLRAVEQLFASQVPALRLALAATVVLILQDSTRFVTPCPVLGLLLGSPVTTNIPLLLYMVDECPE